MDEELEALIDKAGRDRVFARARALGWGPYSSPEKWVWRQICADVMSEKPGPVPPVQRLDEAILGFRLI